MRSTEFCTFLVPFIDRLVNKLPTFQTGRVRFLSMHVVNAITAPPAVREVLSNGFLVG